MAGCFSISIRALQLLVGVGLLAGCATTGRIPPDPYGRVQTPEPGLRRLQVIVAYGFNGPTHAAIRLVRAGELTFWDPGGEYPDLPDRTYNRRRDVIEGRPETLEDYWDYRRKLGEAEMLVFEWDLTSMLAQSLEAALREPSGAFDPETQSGYCARAAVDYLNRFFFSPGESIRSSFSPDALAQQLWERTPDRVWIYRQSGDHPTCYGRNGGE